MHEVEPRGRLRPGSCRRLQFLASASHDGPQAPALLHDQAAQDLRLRPEALREATRRAAAKSAAAGRRGRLAPGEKPNRKRMATAVRQVCCRAVGQRRDEAFEGITGCAASTHASAT